MVVVEQGKILDILPYDARGNFRIHDIEDASLLPGLIDPHVHINEPGRTHWEGFDTATKAAIAGGITTLVDMPLNSSPVTISTSALKEKKNATLGQLHANVGFWGGLVPGNEHEVENLIEEGVLGFKGFLTHSGIDEFPNVTEKELRQTLPIIARYGLPVLLHCELSEKNEAWKTADKRIYANYLASRPRHWEDNAVKLAISLAEKYKVHIHIVHLSSSDSIAHIAEAKKRGVNITVETAQHYLFFNAENIPDGATQFKCAPPIRELENNLKLWEALKEGIIDFVATDHSPAPPELKQLSSGDFSSAWGGIASLQFAFSALWTAAEKKGHELEEVVQWLCEKPSHLIDQHSRGGIRIGAAADLVVMDTEKEFEVEQKTILHKHKTTPYLHHTLKGKVKETYIAGEKVYDRGAFTALNKGKIISHPNGAA